MVPSGQANRKPAGVKRRIVFSNYDSLANPFYGGGGARAIHEIARRRAARQEVRVVAGAFPGCRDGVVDGVAYEHLGRAGAGGKTGQLWFQFRLPGRARRGDFDLWVESLTPPFSTACLQKFTPRPVIALTQVLGGKAMARKYKLPFGLIERLGLRTYRHSIALSEFLKGEILQASPRATVAVIPNGVPGELIRQSVEREERHILFLGRLDVEQKGLDLLLDAVAGLVGHVDVRLVIAGSGTPGAEAWLRRRIAVLRLGDRVQLAGPVSGPRKHDLLRQAFFLAMPSRFEASPLVMLEAFAYGLPVVLYDIPELHETPDECCVKTTPFDVAGLSRAMADLWRDGPRRAALGRAAKAHSRRFDWDDLARRYEDFFETVLEKG